MANDVYDNQKVQALQTIALTLKQILQEMEKIRESQAIVAAKSR